MGLVAGEKKTIPPRQKKKKKRGGGTGGAGERVFWALASRALGPHPGPFGRLAARRAGLLPVLDRFRARDPSAFAGELPPRHEDPGPAQAPRLHFIEFRLKAPKAKRVELLGDFNGWKAGTLLLTHEKGGDWEMMLPLPPGRYRYLLHPRRRVRLGPGEPGGRRRREQSLHPERALTGL